MTTDTWKTRLQTTVWPLLGYTVLAIVFTWPLATQLTTAIGGGLDPLLQTWVLAWDAHILMSDPLMAWHAPIFFPYPETLAYSDHHLLLAAVALPLLASGQPILAYNLLVLLSYVLTGWAVYVLGRTIIDPVRRTPAGAAGAFVAGAVFACGTYRTTHFVHLQLLQTAWLPLALLFLIRLLRSQRGDGVWWRNAVLFGLFAGIQCVTALYYAYLAAFALGLYVAVWFIPALWRSVRSRTTYSRRQPAGLAIGGAIAATIAAPFMLPYLNVYHYLGIVRSPRELDNWSAPLQAYLAVPPANWWYGAAGGLFTASGGEFALFPGLMTLALALVGAVLVGARGSAGAEAQHAGSLRWDVLFLVLLGSGAFILSLGTGVRLERGAEALPIPLPYTLLYEHVPGFGALRVPARWAMLLHLVLALLAGVALAQLLNGSQRTQQPASGPAYSIRWWRSPGRVIVLVAVMCAMLAEHLAIPPPLAVPPPAPPVYAWLGAPAQHDIRAVLELPVGPTPRGAELERITLRQFHQIQHWKPLVLGYSGIIPFGTTDVMRRIQRLPDDETLRYLALLGVDTLVIHRDEYDEARLEPLLAWAETTPFLRRRAEVGDALVYMIAQAALPPGPEQPGASVFVSSDERVPGVLALALTRRWETAGMALYGAGRTRYYPPLAVPRAGQVFDYGVLAADEDPAVAGFEPAGLLWTSNGLAFYAGDPALRAALDLARPVPGQFHPAYPAAFDLAVNPDRARTGDLTVTWNEPLDTVFIELDVASLARQTVTIGSASFSIEPGVTTIVAPLTLNETVRVAGQPGVTAMQRLRILAAPRAPAPPATGALAVAAESRIEGSKLLVTAHVGGAGALLVDVRGAAARDDRPVHLLAGSQPIAASGRSELRFETDLLRPAGPWVTQAGEAEDGRYIVYLKSAARAGAAGVPIAKFNVRNGAIVDVEPVPLPLASVR